MRLSPLFKIQLDVLFHAVGIIVQNYCCPRSIGLYCSLLNLFRIFVAMKRRYAAEDADF